MPKYPVPVIRKSQSPVVETGTHGPALNLFAPLSVKRSNEFFVGRERPVPVFPKPGRLLGLAVFDEPDKLSMLVTVDYLPLFNVGRPWEVVQALFDRPDDAFQGGIIGKIKKNIMKGDV